MDIEVELPEKPDPIPIPRLWTAVLYSISQLVGAQFLYASNLRVMVFFAGVASTLAGMQVAFALAARRRARNLQAQVDELYNMAKERVIMLPALVERHGPEQAIEIMKTADHLVDEGDFPNVRDAVAAIERHHDMEPTVFEEG